MSYTVIITTPPPKCYKCKHMKMVISESEKVIWECRLGKPKIICEAKKPLKTSPRWCPRRQ